MVMSLAVLRATPVLSSVPADVVVVSALWGDGGWRGVVLQVIRCIGPAGPWVLVVSCSFAEEKLKKEEGLVARCLVYKALWELCSSLPPTSKR